MDAQFDFEKLIVFQKTRRLIVPVYQIANSFPADERFALTNQIKRAAVSVASNIAEGNSRRSPRDKCHFLRIAHGSLMELMSQLIIGADLKFYAESDLEPVRKEIVEISRMISSMIGKFLN